MKIKVLVVDDSLFMCDYITTMLSTDPQIEVVGHARSGLEAIEKIEALTPDIITLDLDMPNMNGLETLKYMRRKKTVPAAIIVSGLTQQSTHDVLEALQLGADHFLFKPAKDWDRFKMELVEQVKLYGNQKKRQLSQGRNRRVLQYEVMIKVIAQRLPLHDILSIISWFIEDHCDGLSCSIYSFQQSNKSLKLGGAPSITDPLFVLEEIALGIDRINDEHLDFFNSVLPVHVLELMGPFSKIYPVAKLNDLNYFIIIPVLSVQNDLLGGLILFSKTDTLQQHLGSLNSYNQLVRIAIEHNNNISKVYSSQNQIQKLVNFDSLTGLPNRFYFQQKIEQSMLEGKHKFGILHLDIDRFKLINDAFGLQQGDALLKKVGARIRVLLQEGDFICRMGGDEFVILLAQADEKKCRKVALDILNAFKKPFSFTGNDLYVTSSIGGALYPYHGTNFRSLMKNASLAMKEVKEGGKNNFTFYSATKEHSPKEILILQNDLHVAVEKGQFLVYFQPRYKLDTGKIIGAEALIRWNHPKLGLLPPMNFIPLAEETGLIIDLDHWVLEQACKKLSEWEQKGLDLINISTNISVQHFQRTNLVEQVRHIIETYNINGKNLELEITESMLMKNVDYVIDELERLKTLDIKISIDDFGTGYSSLSYLEQFPISSLKIDKSFVIKIQNNTNKEIAHAIIQLAKSLNLHVIAEGIETKEHLEFLIASGCSEGQGYYFSKPLPIADFEQLLFKQQREEGRGCEYIEA
ncbi:EAL domain-containing protein [Alkalihalobacterium sp. APHAB7]|uniref:EAL domain-containing protein n=1 Tax=Alkalihalobacterium sp. APHAB7 TaxID=3402081 RepID=UPI003AAF5CC6